MRILPDESLPRKLALELIGHEVETVQKRGWSGFSNGELLRVASPAFDVLLTGDRNLQYQQNLGTLPIAVIVLVATNNRLQTLRPLVPKILEKLKVFSPGQLITIQ